MGIVNTIIDMAGAFSDDFKIRYIVDILIIAFAFYKILGLIKETRAEQLVKGFIVVLIISKLSEWLKLYAVNYVLKSTFTIGLIALVIIFQPELRKALEHVGRTQWLLNSRNRPTVTDLEEEVHHIVEAVTNMSRKKIGALIVFERSIGIKDIIDSGTDIDALVSPQMIMNIFFPNSPLHDGALVIKNFRMTAAGCLLPLSSNKFISKELGTRHRAAIGMVESSDAVVVVVSEETGAISVAVDGKLNRYLDSAALKDILLESLSHNKRGDMNE